MQAGVIVGSDPRQNFVTCRAARSEIMAMKALGLERTEQTFGDGVVPAIALSAHRRAHCECLDLLGEGGARGRLEPRDAGRNPEPLTASGPRLSQATTRRGAARWRA